LQTTDVMIHIDAQLDLSQQQAIESELRGIEGVIAPRFNKPHLLVVSYDSDVTNASVLLKAVKDKGYQAQLVGM
jgi:hypothetical protein